MIDDQLTSCLPKVNIFDSRYRNIDTFEMDSPLVTHVLNTADGVPAACLALSLHRLDPQMALWNLITTGTTDENGHCPGLISRQDFTVGMYKLRFETGQYWESLGQTSFYPYVEIVFRITDLDQRYHVPLHLSRYTYSVYRCSSMQ